MNKKGFTLVELLAVIAILAILVLVAVPNVLGMFNNAKKDTFATETKDMVRIAQQQYLADFGKHTRYAIDGTETCTSSSADLAAGKYCKINKDAGNLDVFKIEFDAKGNVIVVDSDDGTYYYEYTKSGGSTFDVKSVVAKEKSKSTTTKPATEPSSTPSETTP